MWGGILAAFTIVVLAIEYPSLLQAKAFIISLKQMMFKTRKLKRENRFL